MAVFEVRVWEGEDGGVGAAVGVGALDGGVVEADEYGGSGHGEGWCGRYVMGLKVVDACKAERLMGLSGLCRSRLL